MSSLREKLEMRPCENHYAYELDLNGCKLTLPAETAKVLNEPVISSRFLESLIAELQLRCDLLKLRYLL